MRLAGLRCLATVVALALLGVAAPTSGLAQGSATTDAASDQADQTPSAELRIDEAFGRAWLGASDADVTLVVFADYACPACRTAQPVIDQLLAQDHKLKVVYRLLDNDQGGRTAALTSLAVARQGADWGKFHRALDTASDAEDDRRRHRRERGRPRQAASHRGCRRSGDGRVGGRAVAQRCVHQPAKWDRDPRLADRR
jgi:hypothetical protein